MHYIVGFKSSYKMFDCRQEQITVSVEFKLQVFRAEHILFLLIRRWGLREGLGKFVELLVDFNQMIAGVGHQRVFIRGPNLQAYLCIPADGQTPPGLKVHSEPTSVTEDCVTSERKEMGREITDAAIKHNTQTNKRFVLHQKPSSALNCIIMVH